MVHVFELVLLDVHTHATRQRRDEAQDAAKGLQVALRKQEAGALEASNRLSLQGRTFSPDEEKEAQFQLETCRQRVAQTQREIRANTNEVSDTNAALEQLQSAFTAGVSMLKQQLGTAAISAGDAAVRKFIETACTHLSPVESAQPVYLHFETADDVPYFTSWEQRTTSAIHALREKLRVAHRGLVTLLNETAAAWEGLAGDPKAHAALIEHCDGALATVAKRQVMKAFQAHERVMQGRCSRELFAINLKLSATSQLIFAPPCTDVEKLIQDVLAPLLQIGADLGVMRDLVSERPAVRLDGPVDAAAVAHMGVVNTSVDVEAVEKSIVTGQASVSHFLRNDSELTAAWKSVRAKAQALNSDVNEVESAVAAKFGHLCTPDMVGLTAEQLSVSLRQLAVWDPKVSIQGAVLVNAFPFQDALQSMIATQLSKVQDAELRRALEDFGGSVEETSLATLRSVPQKSLVPSSSITATALGKESPAMRQALRPVATAAQNLVASPQATPVLSSTHTKATEEQQPAAKEASQTAAKAAPRSTASSTSAAGSPSSPASSTSNRENIPVRSPIAPASTTEGGTGAVAPSPTAPVAKRQPLDSSSLRSSLNEPGGSANNAPRSAVVNLPPQESPRPHTTPVNTRKILQSWDRTNTMGGNGGATSTTAASVDAAVAPPRHAVPPPPPPPPATTEEPAQQQRMRPVPPATDGDRAQTSDATTAPLRQPRTINRDSFSERPASSSSSTTISSGGKESQQRLPPTASRSAWESPVKQQPSPAVESPTAAAAPQPRVKGTPYSMPPSAPAASATTGDNHDDVHGELQRLIQRERESMDRLKQLLARGEQRRQEEVNDRRTNDASDRSRERQAVMEAEARRQADVVEEENSRRQRDVALQAQHAAAKKRQDDELRAQQELEAKLEAESKRRQERQAREAEEREKRRRETEASEQRRRDLARDDDAAREKELRDRLDELDRRRRAEQLRFQEEQRALEMRLANGPGTGAATTKSAAPTVGDPSQSSALRRKLSLPGIDPRSSATTGTASVDGPAEAPRNGPAPAMSTPRRNVPPLPPTTGTPSSSVRAELGVGGVTSPTREQPSSPTMSLLDLYKSQCAELGIKPNSGLLKSLPKEVGKHVSSLNLDLNYIGIKGVIPLFAVLRQNRGLTFLNLKDNNLENNEVRTLCAILAEEPGAMLSHLDLSNNPISLAGGSAVMDLVSRQPALTSVVLRGTLIQPKVVEKIAEAAKSNANR